MDKLSLKSVEEERTITRASVSPSERLTNDKHQFWIVFKSERSVITSFCTCTARHTAVQLMSNGPCLNFKEFETEKKNSIPCETSNIYMYTGDAMGNKSDWYMKELCLYSTHIIKLNHANIALLLQEATQKYWKLTDYWTKSCCLSLPFSLFTVACAVYSGKLRRILNVTGDHSWNI